MWHFFVTSNLANGNFVTLKCWVSIYVQGLIELIFIGQIIKQLLNIMLPRPGHECDFGNTSYMCTGEI